MGKKLDTLWEGQSKIIKQLRELPTDKDRVKLILKTIHENNEVEARDLNSVAMISFCAGYLGSLLVRHDLNDFEATNLENFKRTEVKKRG